MNKLGFAGIVAALRFVVHCVRSVVLAAATVVPAAQRAVAAALVAESCGRCGSIAILRHGRQAGRCFAGWRVASLFVLSSLAKKKKVLFRVKIFHAKAMAIGGFSGCTSAIWAFAPTGCARLWSPEREPVCGKAEESAKKTATITSIIWVGRGVRGA